MSVLRDRDCQDLSGKFQHFHQTEGIDSNIGILLMVLTVFAESECWTNHG